MVLSWRHDPTLTLPSHLGSRHPHHPRSGHELAGPPAARPDVQRPVLVLDDPFSALDKKTEAQIFANVKELARDSIVILISHRLYLFDQMDQVIWLNEGQAVIGSHQEVRDQVEEYRRLYDSVAV